MKIKIPKIKDVKVEEDYIVIVTFENNIVKKYDMKPWLNIEEFEILKDKIIFSMAKVDVGGYGISWNDEADISEYELWTKGKQIN
ncbi:hypothetical protein CLTEP_06250 [Clostridium tepidiprofundi DSM 19306]|uniref:DUF2442 domain-containing protein n=1 Tax=Clostridium tepidiprofundi DSM 19306 TaxID=1121338 RepID=A0A151B6D0_9CLOT|nr:DUF2442 domain-containing protein [Clostridium tepidiprofundi]KYH35449.1 hypothetical protein CLTEP_06250 [Clostridium tepidiprofundi DSM 19306]